MLKILEDRGVNQVSKSATRGSEEAQDNKMTKCSERESDHPGEKPIS